MPLPTPDIVSRHAETVRSFLNEEVVRTVPAVGIGLVWSDVSAGLMATPEGTLVIVDVPSFLKRNAGTPSLLRNCIKVEEL